MQSSCSFVSGNGMSSLRKALEELSPRCENCHCPKERICIERCCRIPYCLKCEEHQHFLHRSNDMYVLTYKVEPTMGEQPLRRDLLEEACSWTPLLRSQILQIIDQHEPQLSMHLIIYFRELEAAIANTYWHNALQSALADYMAEKVDVAEARNRVSQALADMKQSDPVDPRTKQLEAAIASCEPIVTKSDLSLKDSLHHYFRERITETGIESMLSSTCYENFISQEVMKKASVVDWRNRSRLVTVEELRRSNGFPGKRLWIENRGCQHPQLNLEQSCPCVEELWMSFEPARFPPYLKKLTLTLRKFPPNWLSNLPCTLKYLYLQVPSKKSGMSDIMMDNIRKLPELVHLELSIGNISVETLESQLLSQLGSPRTVLIWPLAGSGWVKKCMKKFDKAQHRWRMQRKATFLQAAQLYRCKHLQQMCTAFREGLLDALVGDHSSIIM